MAVLVWLAIPVLATSLAALVVPALQRRRCRVLTPVQRAARLRAALEPSVAGERARR